MTTIPSTPTCSTCRWWEPDEAETGRCRINPPQPDLLVALEAALRSAERDYSEPPLDWLLRGLCSSTSPLYGCWPTTEPYDFAGDGPRPMIAATRNAFEAAPCEPQAEGIAVGAQSQSQVRRGGTCVVTAESTSGSIKLTSERS